MLHVENLTAAIGDKQILKGLDPETRIFIRGDKTIDYGRVMEVMGMLGGAGFTKVALVTEMRQGDSDGGKPAKKGAR